MYYLQLIGSGFLLFISAGIIIAWYRGMYNKQAFTSIRFLGGTLGALGLYLNPLIDLGYLVLLPFFLDYFSLPVLVVDLGQYIIKRFR